MPIKPLSSSQRVPENSKSVHHTVAKGAFIPYVGNATRVALKAMPVLGHGPVIKPPAPKPVKNPFISAPAISPSSRASYLCRLGKLI